MFKQQEEQLLSSLDSTEIRNADAEDLKISMVVNQARREAMADLTDAEYIIELMSSFDMIEAPKEEADDV